MIRRAVVGLFALSLTASSCGRPSPTPEPPCSGHSCTLTVQNNGALGVALRFGDTSGRIEVLGLVLGQSVRAFRLQWVRSSIIRVFAQTTDRQTFYADVRLDATMTVELRFPDDFAPADVLDSLPVRRPPSAEAR